MLGDIIDLLLYPIEQFFGLLTDSAVEDYLGVSVLGIIVTLMIISIVIRALISSTGVGYGMALNGNIKARLTQRSYTRSERRANAQERLNK